MIVLAAILGAICILGLLLRDPDAPEDTSGSDLVILLLCMLGLFAAGGRKSKRDDEDF